jgi:opacity protein-like surface antigen
VAAAGAVCFLSMVAPASAQRRWEVSAAYDFTRDWTGDVNYAAGWTVGSAVDVNSWLSAVAEAGASYKNIPVTGSDIRLRLYPFFGGARVRRSTHRVTEFAQLEGGAARTSGSAFGTTDTSTHAAVQLGGGADYALTPRLSLRGEIDFRVVFGEQQVDSQHHGRFLVGIAYAIR